jgi:hypothetical protein
MNGPTNNDPKFEGAGKLIGGYSSGNLSSQEKEALFNAALRDQSLFDALMEEQALKDLLEEPGIKAELIQSLQPKSSLLDRIKSFLATPVAWGTMGAVATAAVLLTVILPTTRNQSTAPQTTAENRPPEARRDLRSQPPVQQQPPPTPQVQPQRTSPATNEAAPTAPPPAPPEQPLMARKEQEKREAPGPSQERDRQQQVAPQQSPAPLQEPLAIQQQPVPAASVGAVGNVLAIDYSLLRRAPDGSFQTATTVRQNDSIRLQVMPSENGYLSLYRRTPDGLLTAITVSQPVTRGQVTQIPRQTALSVSEGSYLLLLSRETTSADDAKKSAPGGATQGFRQTPVEMRAKRAASPAKAPADTSPTGALLDLSLRKAVLPSVSLGRAAASSPSDRSVAVEFTIRVEN